MKRDGIPRETRFGNRIYVNEKTAGGHMVPGGGWFRERDYFLGFLVRDKCWLSHRSTR